MEDNPNFPSDLNIKPSLASPHDLNIRADPRFDTAAQRDAIDTYGIAGRVWEASYVLLSYLDRIDQDEQLEFNPPPFTKTSASAPEPLTIIELGSGSGRVASRIAEYMRCDQDLLIATDLPEVCSLLKRNLPSCSSVRVWPLSWGNQADALSIASYLRAPKPTSTSDADVSRNLTHIVCSDLVYFPALLAPLLRTLLHLTSPPFLSPVGDPATVFISYKIRSLPKETAFWTAFGLWFSFSPLLSRPATQSPSRHDDGRWNRFPSTDEDDEMFVFVAQRRRESFLWPIPESDWDLLSGVGARGTSVSKADETFETLLLMLMDT